MKAAVAILLLFLSFRVGAQSENTFNELDQNYEKINEFRFQLFTAAYKEFGAKIKAAAMLEACGKKDLATAVMPSDEELLQFLSQRIAQAGLQSNATAEVLNKRGNQMGFHLLKISYFQLSFYRGGYLEAVIALKPLAPSVCIAAEEMVKNLHIKDQ